MNIVHGNIFVNQKQASCEADVLSCYYLHALNITEAVRLVIFPSLSFHFTLLRLNFYRYPCHFHYPLTSFT